MRKVILVFCVVLLASCGSTNQNDSGSDTLSVIEADSSFGVKVDSVKVDSVKVDSVK